MYLYILLGVVTGFIAHNGAFSGASCFDGIPAFLSFLTKPCLVVFFAEILLSHFLICLDLKGTMHYVQ